MSKDNPLSISMSYRKPTSTRPTNDTRKKIQKMLVNAYEKYSVSMLFAESHIA